MACTSGYSFSSPMAFKYQLIPHFYATIHNHMFLSIQNHFPLQSIETCCFGVKDWMTTNMLKYNELNIDTVKKGDSIVKLIKM